MSSDKKEGAARELLAPLCEGRASDLLLTVLSVAFVVSLVTRGFGGVAGGWLSPPVWGAALALHVLLRAGWRRRHAIRERRLSRWFRNHAADCYVSGLLVVALAVRLWGIDFGEPLVMHNDEHAAVGAALRMLRRGSLAPPTPFKYPTVYMYLVLPFLGLTFVRGKAGGIWTSLTDVGARDFPFFLTGRYLSAFLGAATVVLVYAAARRLWPGWKGRAAGCIAATYMTFSYEHVRSSHLAVTDATVVFFVVVAFLAVVTVYRQGSWRSYLWAGFLSGIACAAKYTALPIVFALIAAHLLGRLPRRWLSLRFLGGLVAIPAGFFTGYPYALIDYRNFLEHLGKIAGWSTGSPDPVGRSLLILDYSMGIGMGAPFAVALLVAAVIALHRRRRRAILLLVPVVVNLALLTGGSRHPLPRYLLPLMPFASLLVAGLVVDVAEWLRDSWKARGWSAQRVMRAIGSGGSTVGTTGRGSDRPSPGSRPALVAVCALATVVLVLPQARESIAWDRLMARRDTRALAYEFIVTGYGPGTIVATEDDELKLPRDYVRHVWTPLHSRPFEHFQRKGVELAVFSGAWDRSDETKAVRRRLLRHFQLLREFDADGTTTRGPTIRIYRPMYRDPRNSSAPEESEDHLRPDSDDSAR